MVAIAGLGVSLAGVLLSHHDRPADRDPRLMSEFSARDLTRQKRSFVNTIVAAPEDVIELRLLALNLGGTALTNVTIGLRWPASWAATLVEGSCRIRWGSRPFRPCDDGLGEDALRASRLDGGERLEARARFAVVEPPCHAAWFDQWMTADSDETAVTGTATVRVGYDDVRPDLPACETHAAALRMAIPLATRSTCESRASDGRGVLAQVSCRPDDDRVQEAVYMLYGSRARAGRAYDDVIRGYRTTACGAYDRGYGEYPEEDDGLYRFSCYGGSPVQLDWVDEGRHVVGYANAPGGDLDGLLAWWTAEG